MIQDLGYYPFGEREFTNLLHCVRTGDFVAWMHGTHATSTNTPSRWARSAITLLIFGDIPRSMPGWP